MGGHNIYIPKASPFNYINTFHISNVLFENSIYQTFNIPSNCKLLILTTYDHYHLESTDLLATLTNNTLIESQQVPGKVDDYGYLNEVHTFYIINPNTGNQTISFNKNSPDGFRFILSFYGSDGNFTFLDDDISQHSETDWFGKNISTTPYYTNLLYISEIAFRRSEEPRISGEGTTTYQRIWQGLIGGFIGFSAGYKIIDAELSEYLMQMTEIPYTEFEYACQYLSFKVI